MRLSWRRFAQFVLLFGLFLFLQVLVSGLFSVRQGTSYPGWQVAEDGVAELGQNGEGLRILQTLAEKRRSLLVQVRADNLKQPLDELTNPRVSISKELFASVPHFINNNSTININARKHLQNLRNNSRKTELSDIFISIKTTKKFHATRLDALIDTWVSVAKDVTFFFTDDDDELYKNKTGGHLINTGCPATHHRSALCCKMSVEFDMFIESGKRWFCHADDDTYINVPKLLHVLRDYNHTGDWYIGKPSLPNPVTVYNVQLKAKVSFWFATGGAGFCLSRGIALKMVPHIGGGKFKRVCDDVRLPDDCTMGYVVYKLMDRQLTTVKGFHSHLEGLSHIKAAMIKDQVSLSYTKDPPKMIDMPAIMPEDKTRFYSIH